MILLADKIEKSFGARVLLNGASFQINAGERYALVGPNGAGKTTLLKIIMGIDSCDGGTIQFAKDTQVGYLEQETNLASDTSIIQEVVASAQEIRKMGERAQELQGMIAELSEKGEDVSSLLDEYGRVQDRFEHLGGYELESNAKKILSGLGFHPEDFTRAGKCASHSLSFFSATPIFFCSTSLQTTLTSKAFNGFVALSPAMKARSSS